MSQAILQVVAAVAMGLQNAVPRRIAVPDLNTSVVSMSMIGLAADHTHSTRQTALRRVLAVLRLLAAAGLWGSRTRHTSLTSNDRLPPVGFQKSA